MDRVYIAWTIENWITVVLMATLGYLLFSLLWRVVSGAGSGSAGGSSSALSGWFSSITGGSSSQ